MAAGDMLPTEHVNVPEALFPGSGCPVAGDRQVFNPVQLYA